MGWNKRKCVFPSNPTFPNKKWDFLGWSSKQKTSLATVNKLWTVLKMEFCTARICQITFNVIWQILAVQNSIFRTVHNLFTVTRLVFNKIYIYLGSEAAIKNNRAMMVQYRHPKDPKQHRCQTFWFFHAVTGW